MEPALYGAQHANQITAAIKAILYLGNLFGLYVQRLERRIYMDSCGRPRRHTCIALEEGSRAFPNSSNHFRAKSLPCIPYFRDHPGNGTVQLTFPYRGFSVYEYTRLFVSREMQKEREG